MRFEVYDVDDRNNLNNLKKQELIGTAEFMLHEVIRAKDQILRLPLSDKGKSAGTLKLHAEEVKEKLSSDIAHLTIECNGSTVSYPMLYRLFRSDGGSFFPVYQSEASRSTNGNILWHQVKIPAASLFRDDQSRQLRIELYEYSSKGSHKPVDAKDFQFSAVLDGFKLGTRFGTVVFKNVSVEKRASFLEYLFGGCQISLAIAIDFTGSNGDPDVPGSLHSMNMAKNQYIQAIRAIGETLQEYDSDKNIPVFGFGAKIPGIASTSHCFALNGNIFAPEVHTIDGVLNVYNKNMGKLQFSGPTNFAEIIRYFGDFAYWHVSNGLVFNYFVLLMITDGLITDMENTIDEIVRCSGLPMSIIITGVGDANFHDMDRLDSDTQPLFSKKLGKYAVRDMVQFVPFNKFAGNAQELARQTLAELPKQLVDYMTAMKIPSNAPIGMPSGPSFYTLKQNEFIGRFMNTGMGENATQLIKVGYPVMDIGAFSNALKHGYQNTLHC
eukprot:TRINITY_DN2571_c0_g2_i8.p1 TRINITY_DN2571_c0_g2~~TRINITY_DN2571_c0_g2_i8.p1  ORF type:complete len:496 (-),score=78.55 TRINITY_DN2571_c0_g2_i8:164-1651(-)